MAEQQQLLAQQAEMRKAEVGLKETKPVKTGTTEAGAIEAGTVKMGAAQADTDRPRAINTQAIQSQLTQSEVFQSLVSRMGGGQNILAHAKALQNGKAETETAEIGATEVGPAEAGTIKSSLPQEVSQQRTIQIETPQDGGAQTVVVQGEAVRMYNDRATEPAIVQASTLQTGLSQREDAQSMGTSGSSQRETLQNTEIQTEPIETGAIEIGFKAGTADNQFVRTQTGQRRDTETGGSQDAASQASAHGLGNDFEVNTAPHDEAQKIFSSTEHRMAEKQHPLAQQTEMGNTEVGLDETKSIKTGAAETGAIETEIAERGTVKTGADQSRTINREAIQSQSAQSKPFQSLSSQIKEGPDRLNQTEGGPNILTQAELLQAGPAQANIAQTEGFQTAINQPEPFQNRPTQTISATHSSELLQNEGLQNVEPHHGITQADTSQSRKDERMAGQSRAAQIETRQGEGTQTAAAVVRGEAAQAFHNKTTESATAQARAPQAGLSQREGSQVMGGQTGSSQIETSQKRESQTEPTQTGIAKTGTVKTETVENQLSQTQIGQTGSAESRKDQNASSQALAQSIRGDLKVSLPSQRDLKEKLTSIEDKLMEQQEFFERETLQRKEKVPSK